MSLLSKIMGRTSKPVVERAKRLPNRFLEGGCFQEMGAVTRRPRENTSAEIIKSITAYADIYESGAKSAEPKLIEFASEYGVNLKKEAKRLGVDIFEAAKRKGKVEHDIKYTDFFGIEKTERRVVDLTEVATDALAQKHLGETNAQELRNFLAQTDGMSTEQLGIAHDIIDLAHMNAMLNTNINLQRIIENGRSIMGDLLAKFPEISRKNPGAIELIGKVFNHSDDSNSKYFLLNLFGNDLAKLGHLSEQMTAVKELVPTIARETLNGGYLMDFSKENRFFNLITSFCRPDAKPENIKLLPRIFDIIDGISKKTNPSIDTVSVALGDSVRIGENIKVLPQVLENFEHAGKSLDVSEFLTRNVTLG